jgi:hypothetical protein
MADTKLEAQQQPHAGGLDYGIVALVVGFLLAAAVVFFG